MTFQRVHNETFRLITSSNEKSQEIFLSIPGLQTREAYDTAAKIASYIDENKLLIEPGDTRYFEHNGKLFTFYAKSQRKREWLARSIANYFKFYRNTSKVEVEITETSWWEKLTTTINPIQFKDESVDSFLPKLNRNLNDPSTTAFSDPYTNLATRAFQKFESDFSSQDRPNEPANQDHSEYRILENGDRLSLVKLSDATACKNDPTMKNYRKALIKAFGKDKVKHTAYLYHIDLSNNQPLTPEIIYRMNIGMGSLEKQDLDNLVKKLDTLLKNFYEGDLLNKLTTQEIRGIGRLCCKGKEDLSEKKLSAWLTQTYVNLSNIEKLTVAISILSFTGEERTSQYTGREIVYPMRSVYSIADLETYKPWIEQQEILHTFTTLEKVFKDFDDKQKEDAYNEILCHIISRKHLIKKHPETLYGVGSLIPAPPHPTKGQRWYVVTDCVSNSKGIFSYTLKPLDETDLSLPVRKIFRNMAPSNYVMDNKASVKNVLNPINPPGYEGANRSEIYDEDLYLKRSIPLWVAYNLEASKQIKNKDTAVSSTLKSAVTAYAEEMRRKHSPKSMTEIIREQDASLIELAKELITESVFNFFTVCRLILLLNRHKFQETDSKTQYADAEYLLSLIKNRTPKHKDLSEDLLKVLKRNPKSLEEQLTDKKIVITLQGLLRKKEYDNLNQLLDKLAKETGEHPDQKIKQAVITQGHSLGAACSEVAFVKYTSKLKRVPMVEFALRTFDPPAIRRSDNASYKAFGEHAELFKKLGVKFSIIHRIEAADFVSQSGEEHVGATSNETERKSLLKWTDFEASVSQGVESSSHPDIRDTVTAHTTLFERGKREPTYLLETANQVLREENLSKKEREKVKEVARELIGDYTRTWVDPTVLSHYDNGNKHTWTEIRKVFSSLGIRSDYVESLRSLAGLIIRVILAKFSILDGPIENQSEAGHDDWWNHRDENGVFAVNVEDGIISY